MNAATRINKLRERGYTPAEITRLTGISKSKIDYVRRREQLAELSEIERTAIKLLYKVPVWWQHSNEEWRRVVRANFADVLQGVNHV
jgi:hypothetical protein